MTDTSNIVSDTKALDVLVASIHNELAALGYDVDIVDQTPTTTILGVRDALSKMPFSIVVNVTP